MSAAWAPAQDYDLVKNGKPASCIVLAENAGVVEKHAAAELAAFLAKISGSSEQVAIGQAPVKDLYPIYLELVSDQRIDQEGFCLKANRSGLRIQAKEPIGVLYGVYEILKKYGGIRWLVPGAAGEYFKLKPTIVIPEMDTVSNPSFKIRTLHFCCASIDSPNYEVYDWMVRNNMNIEMDLFQLKIPDAARFLEARGATLRGGWHCFTRLHNGINVAESAKTCFADYETMFREHPERFPLINGQRRFLEGQKYQPCTSDPDNIKIMAKNLVAEMRACGMDKRGGRYILVNNDNTSWCECARCKAEADPGEAQAGGIATRYWKFINALTDEARKELPDLPAVGYAYQNYQRPPLGVKPDPRLPVMLSYNRKCYRHTLQDPDCPVNSLYYSYFKEWSKLCKTVYTWEEMSGIGREYQPSELIYVELLKEYFRLGIDGTTPSIPPLYAKYGPRYQGTTTPDSWLGMWQTLYLAALVQWDVNTDAVKALEEANALYYGPAWENGMREYRQLLMETSRTSPGCFGHGLQAPLGRNLTRPGVEAKLTAALARAEKAAEGNALACVAVRRDKEFFNTTWVKQNRLYVENYREMRAYPRKGVIRIDGKLDEPDWINADIVGNFRVTAEKEAKSQSAVRIIYELDYLYVAIEAMESSMNRIKSIHTERDGKIWEDNSVELFLNHPDMGGSYYHFIINDKGALRDARFDGPVSMPDFDSQAVVAVGRFSDRWVVEMQIPTSTLGMKCFPGHTWRMNSQRYRVVDGEDTESSSLAAGAGHNVQAFLPVAFSSERSVNKDTRFWKNASLNETWVLSELPQNCKVRDGKIPAHWHLAGTGGSVSMERHFGNSNDLYMKLENCRIFQLHKGKQSQFRIVLDAKGPGKMEIAVYRYTRTPQGDSDRHLGTDYILKAQPPEDKWQTYKVDFKKESPEEVLGIAIHTLGNGALCVDNVFVQPMDEGT